MPNFFTRPPASRALLMRERAPLDGAARVAAAERLHPTPAAGVRREPALPWEAMKSCPGVGPAGNDALLDALQAAMIPYSPDELVALANKEFAWCDKEMLRASNEMGFGNDWKKASTRSRIST